MRFYISMGSIRSLVFAAICLFVAAALPNQRSLAQSMEKSGTSGALSRPSTAVFLDGLQFNAGIVRAEDGSENTLEDTLIFRDGKFSSVVCKRYNFTAAPYWVRTEGNRIHFLAELTSPTDGKMVWQGTVTGGELEGTMRWTRERWYRTIDAEHKIRGMVDPDAQSVSASPR